MSPAPVCLRGSSLARPGREGVRLPHIPCSRLPAGLGCGHPPLGLSPLLGPSLTSRSIADFPVGFPINWPLSGGLGSLASSPLWGQVLNDHPRHTEKAAGDFPGVQVVKHPPCKVGDAGPILSQVIKTPHAAEQLSPHATTPEHLCPSPHAPQQERLRDQQRPKKAKLKQK